MFSIRSLFFALKMFHVVEFCSPVVPHILRFNPRCGQTMTWRHPVCNSTVQAVSAINLFYSLTYSRVYFILHCEVIFVWNQRHLIFSFRDSKKHDFCFVLNCKASFLTVFSSVYQLYWLIFLCLSVTVSLTSIDSLHCRRYSTWPMIHWKLYVDLSLLNLASCALSVTNTT